MTLGERLFELRAQKGLSQLELAEALDVSRQSVSKWETDAAVPEIDKLISISRYFGVSIGALLGVEEEAADAAPPAESGELSEAQLKMVEEIVERYVAALPKPMPKKRKTVLKVAVAVAAICLAVGLYKISSQLTELHYRYNDLANSLSMVNSNVNSQIDSITGRVEAALEQQARITADASAEIASLDLTDGTATFAVRATPKTYAEGMRAYFEFENGGESVSFGPVEPDGTSFAMDCAVALTDETAVYVVFERDGTRETQLIDRFRGLYTETLPSLEVVDMPSFTYNYNNNVLVRVSGGWYVAVTPLERAWSVDAPALPRPEIASVEVGLFRDHRLLRWAERMDGAPEGWTTGDDRGTTYYSYPDYPDAIGTLSPGDRLRSVARVTDTAGRVFLFSGATSFVLSEDGTLDGEQDVEERRIDDPSEWDFTLRGE